MIVATTHRLGDLEPLVELLTELSKRGIKRIGMERSPSPEKDPKFIEMLSKFLDSENKNVRETTQIVIEAVSYQGEKFFKQVAEAAARLKIQVDWIESELYTKRIDRLIYPKIIQNLDIQEKILRQDDPRTQRAILALAVDKELERFPIGHIVSNVRDKNMLRLMKDKRPPVIILGNSHAFYIAKKLGISLGSIAFIEDGRLHESPMHGRILRHVKGIKFNELKRKRELAQKRRQMRLRNAQKRKISRPRFYT